MIAPFVFPLAVSLAKHFAPALISKIAGDKSGAVAERVVNIVQAATGTRDPAEAIAIAEADPKIATACTTRLAELDLAETRAFLEDIADARARDVAITETGRKNWRGDILAYLAVGAFISVIVSLMFLEIPDGGARDLLLVMMGVLGAIVKNVYSFEFGSSRGSKDKDSALERLSNGR
jgi:hypothetical protein